MTSFSRAGLPDLSELAAAAQSTLLQRKPGAVPTYLWLLNEVQRVAIDTEEATTFQRRFNGFYGVRRNGEWRGHFYWAFEQAKSSSLPYRDLFASVVQRLYEETGRVEASFCSKLVATLHPQAPIIDSIVARYLAGNLPKPIFSHAPARAVEFYNRLDEVLVRLSTEPSAKSWSSWFDSAFADIPGAGNISSTKKLDFLIWAGSR